VGVTQEINTLYAQFIAGFRAQEQAYLESLSQPSSGTVPFTATVTAPYVYPSPVIQVNLVDAAKFASASQSTPVTAIALVGTTPIGMVSVIGISGNQLIVSLAEPHVTALPVGATLSATVPVSAASSAAGIFPSYITASTTQLAVELVQYFNSLPIRLPRKFALPHQNAQGGAVQTYVFNQIASSRPSSLKNVLLAIALPTTTGPDLQIYDATVTSAVETSHLNVLAGVEQIFAGKLQIPPSSPSSGTTTSSTGTTTGTTAGTTTGGA
jgi:hypothetical protein